MSRDDWTWIESKRHFYRPLSRDIDVLVAWSQRKKGWMVKVYNNITRRLEPYQAGPFATDNEALGIGDYYIKTRIQSLNYLLGGDTESD